MDGQPGVGDLRHRIGESLMRRSRTNRTAAWILAVGGPAIIALALVPLRPSVGLAGFLFATLLVVVAAAVMDGLLPALTSAVIAIPLGDYYFAPPTGSLAIEREGDLFVFLGFVVVAAVLGILVDQLVGMAKQQAALRRVATLVARAAAPDELFAAVTAEVGQELPVNRARMARYEPDGSITFVAAWPLPEHGFAVGSRWKLEGESISATVARTGRPDRIDDYGDISGPLSEEARKLGVRSSVGAPIVVEGHLWGVMLVSSSTRRRLPADAEARLAGFMDLLSTAIANAETRAELAASRARVVAAGDETRRRIERDLMTGPSSVWSPSRSSCERWRRGCRPTLSTFGRCFRAPSRALPRP
jgi:hypothetical protein